MPKLLSEEQINQYHQNGFHFPIDVLDATETRDLRRRLETYENETGEPITGAMRSKSHLVFTWVDKLIRNKQILDAVEDLIGPDVLCWTTVWWIKEKRSESFVSWHQDLRYWGLDTNDLVTVWVALSEASEASGCMRVLPASHQGEMLPHEDRYKETNLLTRGQEIAVDVDETKCVSMQLKAGQASLHNVRLAHASGVNQTDDRRIGLSIHYIPPSARQTAGAWDCATLVRGEDRFGHFVSAPPPHSDLHPEALAFHERASNAFREILFKDAERVREVL
ncbi:MAG: phytanoyl-CoA dioxygenase family protein [Pseudomonadota bacterium]